MRTIALRFSDNFAPKEGTIKLHQQCIDRIGYVWYGKMGAMVSDKVCSQILENDEPRILLIQSGRSSRYWAYIDKITKETPPASEIPEYYRDQAGIFKTWFRVEKFVEADKNVMSNCIVASSGASLSLASRHSMSPYFIIDHADEKHDVESMEDGMVKE